MVLEAIRPTEIQTESIDLDCKNEDILLENSKSPKLGSIEQKLLTNWVINQLKQPTEDYANGAVSSKTLELYMKEGKMKRGLGDLWALQGKPRWLVAKVLGIKSVWRVW